MGKVRSSLSSAGKAPSSIRRMSEGIAAMPNNVAAVRPAVSLRQRSLMPKERRASHEEDRERRQTDVRHGVVAVARRALALVGETGADLAQLPDQLLNGAHPALDLDQGSSPRTKRKPTVGLWGPVNKSTTCGISDFRSSHAATRSANLFARTCLGLRFRWFIRYMTEVCPRSSAG